MTRPDPLTLDIDADLAAALSDYPGDGDVVSARPRSLPPPEARRTPDRCLTSSLVRQVRTTTPGASASGGFWPGVIGFAFGAASTGMLMLAIIH